MKAKVVENLCIGCGACQAVCPEEFEINYDNGLAQAINDDLAQENIESANEAKDGCPTNAILIEEE